MIIEHLERAASALSPQMRSSEFHSLHYTAYTNSIHVPVTGKVGDLASARAMASKCVLIPTMGFCSSCKARGVQPSDEPVAELV